MVKISWCKKTKNGFEIIEPNHNMSKSYIRMAEESIKSLSRVKSNIWIATMSYYIFYYSLYALMLKIGIKCEIHACSLEFMQVYLKDYFNSEDYKAIQIAYTARINLQYYADRAVEQKDIDQSRRYCKLFYIKSKDIITTISEADTKSIRDEFKKS